MEEASEFGMPDDLRARAAPSKTPEERMKVLWEWQERFARWLDEDPEVKERWWRKNLRKRAVQGHSIGPQDQQQ